MDCVTHSSEQESPGSHVAVVRPRRWCSRATGKSHLAACQGYLQPVEVLLRRGAYLRARTDQDVMPCKIRRQADQNRFAYADSFGTAKASDGIGS